MAKRTTVLIYQVDSAGVTGARVGEGSLMGSRYVFVHSPLSDRIASGMATRRLRVAIWDSAAEEPVIEVIDGWGDAQVIGEKEDAGALVRLELRSEPISPVDSIIGLERARTVDEFLERVVPELDLYNEDNWTQNIPRMRNVILCSLLGKCC